MTGSDDVQARKSGAMAHFSVPEIDSEAILNGLEAVVILHHGRRFRLAQHSQGELSLVEEQRHEG